MKNETLYWTIGGVAIALLALFAMSRGGSSGSESGGSTTSQGSVSGNGISASALVSEVNNVNSNAAHVEQDRIAALTQYATHSSDNSVSVFSDLTNAAENELATIESAQTARYASDNATQLGEYQAHENAFTAQAAIGAQQAENAANNASAEAIAKMQTGVLKDISNNQTTIARIQHGSSFGNFMQSLLGDASGFFGGIGVSGIKSLFSGGSGSSATASTGGFV